MYDRILFPTDGSDGAETALEHALDLAAVHDAAIHVLFVVNTTYLGGSAAEATTVDALRTTGETTVEESADRVRDRGVDVTTTIRSGEPYREILDYADEAAADVIVMGTHGRRGLDRYLLGSVTEKVVRAADVPVLTVRADEEG
ncbi:universal stress protein [Halobacteria archaeon HArc-gm2]|nr:universal stress protein [Halobacteria archaeon HArc-gm2]